MPPTSTPRPSFIPREVPRVAGMKPPPGASDIFMLLSIVLLVASGALAGGVFLYTQYLDTSNASKLNQLQIAKKAFEPALIEKLTRLDDRMRVAGEILSKHSAFTLFFDMLQQSTITSVSFTNLSLRVADGKAYTFKMDGIADSVNSIALQADLFSKSGMITSPIFSDIDRRADGVHFSVTGGLNPASVLYSQLAAGAAAIPVSTDPSSFTPSAGTSPSSQRPQAQQAPTAAPAPSQPSTPRDPFGNAPGGTE